MGLRTGRGMLVKKKKKKSFDSKLALALKAPSRTQSLFSKDQEMTSIRRATK